MTAFQRHKKSSFLLFIYLMWWLFMAYFFWIKSNTNPIDEPHCDFSPIIFFYSLPIAIGGSLILFAKHIITKDNSNDYLLFSGLILLPIIIAVGIFSFSATDKKQILQNNPVKLTLSICDSSPKNDFPPIFYKKANHKLGYWIHKKL